MSKPPGLKVLWLALPLLTASSAGARQPNIIVIMADDMGYGGISAYDNHNYKTPEVDRLAEEGLLLTDYHSNGSVCSPTRAALMTGRYQYRMGCHRVINADPEHPDHIRGLPASEWTIAEALKEGGYATALFGKWHIGYKPEFNPIHHGFDQFNGFISGNIDAHSHYDRMITKDWWQNDVLEDEPGYHTDLITENTIEFIQRHKDRPFFIYVSHAAPHSPHQARGSKIQRGPDAGTLPEWGELGMTYSMDPKDENWLMKHYMLPMDEGVGRIRSTIEDLGLAKDTIIWFISDNGGTWNNGTTSINTRSGKGSFYEGGHRVPGIVWAPRRIQPNTRSDELIMGMDIMPTSLTMADIPAPGGHPFDGIDVSATLLNGTGLAERTLIWGREDIDRGAIRKGDWKLVADQLYDLKNDPREAINLTGQFPEKVAALQEERLAIYEEALSSSPYETVVEARSE